MCIFVFNNNHKRKMKNLQPALLWNHFHEITQIPRPSKKEEKMIAYLQSFAQNNGLNYTIDAAGNVLIRKPSTNGNPHTKTLILQAHIDMVCEKNTDVDFNFDTDAIQYYIDEDFIRAKGTTLGGDNGIGMAMMLAILESKDLKHPALECLFTVDEETGLTGAFALDNQLLNGEVLINLDSEDDGVIFIGCAGGIDTTATLNYESVPTPEGFFTFNVQVKGLKGGHSGDDINKGLGNANIVLNRFLWQLNRKMDVRIHSFDGGNLRNAIAREAKAVCSVPWSEKEIIRVELNHYIALIETELLQTEPNLKITLESESFIEKSIDKNSSEKLLNALYACPHGVKAMSADMPGLVETSTNLASVKMLDNQRIRITTSQRSAVESSKHDIAHQVESVFLLAGAEVTHGDGYPGWKPNVNSEILRIAEACYSTLFNQKAEVKAIHAGLECGLFLAKYPHLDMISIGPQMYGVHSPDERLSISSTQKCWNWLIEILKNV
jgi:dipeptidase D